MKKTVQFMTILCGTCFAGTASAAAITAVNTGSISVPDDGGTAQVLDGGTGVSTLSFDAGATADMLIVGLSSERSTEAELTITYNGDLLTRVDDSDDRAGIWYLANPDTGGAFDLTVSFAGITTVNGYGLGVVSVTAGGDSIVLHASSPSDGTDSVLLTTTAAESFVVVNGFANEGPGAKTTSVDSPLTPLYASGNIGSAIGGAGYVEGVASGTNAYGLTYTGSGTPFRTVAAAFTVVPEPSSLALLGLGGLAIARRRR